MKSVGVRMLGWIDVDVVECVRGGERGFASVGGGLSVFGVSLSGGGVLFEKVFCVMFVVEIECVLNFEFVFVDFEFAFSSAFGAFEF